MTWAQRLLQFAVGTDPGVAVVVGDLARLLADGAQALIRVAELAPNGSIEADMRNLAERERALIDRLRDGTKTTSAAAAANPPTAPPAGQNHWARLVSALEHHRLTRQQFIEAAITVEDTQPEVAATLEELARELQPILEALRDLIARADPQALD
jgi:hypothetical protein